MSLRSILSNISSNNDSVENELNVAFNEESLRFIYPFSYKEEKDHIEMGNNFIKILIVTYYAPEQVGDWFRELRQFKGNISIVQHIECTDSETMLENYNNIIKNKNEELYRVHDPRMTMELKNDIALAEKQLETALEAKNSGFVYIYTYICIQGNSQKEVDSLEQTVQRVLTKIRLKAIIPFFKMDNAYWSCLPICQNNLKEYTLQQVNINTASSFFPYDDTEICTLVPGAQIEGTNLLTNSFVSIDYNDKEKTLNRNKIVLGTSGVGKTTYLKQMLLSAIAHGKRSFILDPESEYGKIVEYYGGTVIKLGSISKTIINPLEIFSYELDIECDEEAKKILLIKQKCQNLRGFFKEMKKDMSQIEIAIVEELLINLYKEMPQKKFEELTHEDFPILNDLYEKCNELEKKDLNKYEKIRDFHYILHTYTEGSNTMFNGYTNVNLSSDIVCFDLSLLQTEKDVQACCYLNTFYYLWETIISLGKKNIKNEDYALELFADEFHFMLGNMYSCDFFYQAYKRFRKYKAGCTIATQQVLDVLSAKFENRDIGTSIIENSFTKILFGFDNKSVGELVECLQLNLSEIEKNLLEAKRQGEALIIYGTKRVLMKVKFTKEELRICLPDKYVKKYGEEEQSEELNITELEREEIENYGGGSKKCL